MIFLIKLYTHTNIDAYTAAILKYSQCKCLPRVDVNVCIRKSPMYTALHRTAIEMKIFSLYFILCSSQSSHTQKPQLVHQHHYHQIAPNLGLVGVVDEANVNKEKVFSCSLLPFVERVKMMYMKCIKIYTKHTLNNIKTVLCTYATITTRVLYTPQYMHACIYFFYHFTNLCHLQYL